MPRGSFGNLIALPLNGECRKRRTTLFLDPTSLEPHEDQWWFLSTIERVSSDALASITATIDPIGAGPESVTYRRPRASGPAPKAPEVVRARMDAMLGIQRSAMPPALLSSLKHLASLHNPDFYEKERLRFSTWNTPRFIRSYAETLDSILLPRGLVARASAIVHEVGSRLDVEQGCAQPEPITVSMTAVLTPEQESAADTLADHDHGVLVAPPGSGKTVIACALIARHAVPTLVIVDRKPLVEQWRDRLVTHLDVTPKEVGQLTGGKKRAKGLIDLAMAQSLARMDDLAEITAGYGLVIVDECHHVPAVTFERCVRRIPVRRWIGLTATPYRRDGLEGLITMYCGPIRHRISGAEPLSLPHDLLLTTHPTSFSVPENEDFGIQDIFRALVGDTERTEMICDGVQEAVGAGRNCLVLTQWTEHIDQLRSSLLSRGMNPLVLKGGMGKKARTAVLGELQQQSECGGALLLATGSFLGEGFDFPPLDTLFLAFPIAFKGRVVQYVGRVLRPVAGKDSVEVHDYVDEFVPVLARMHRKRLPGFTSLGFDPTANRIR
jgi:superfamily II DNA or RNA helicase